jgi:hypothetical protein
MPPARRDRRSAEHLHDAHRCDAHYRLCTLAATAMADHDRRKDLMLTEPPARRAAPA